MKNKNFILIVAISNCLSCYFITCLPFIKQKYKFNHDHQMHNRFAIPNCDDTINGIEIDWAGSEDYYRCDKPSAYQTKPSQFVLNETCQEPEISIHKCLNEKIVYADRVPTSGAHRPVWVTYGEYVYMPPQRWVHALEHGAAIFLYDPCANSSEIDSLRGIAQSCLRKHIITPYKDLPDRELFNVVTFGCRLSLSRVHGSEQQIVDYLKRHAISDGPEFPIVENGNYTFGLIREARVVSDLKDSKICPNFKF